MLTYPSSAYSSPQPSRIHHAAFNKCNTQHSSRYSAHSHSISHTQLRPHSVHKEFLLGIGIGIGGNTQDEQEQEQDGGRGGGMTINDWQQWTSNSSNTSSSSSSSIISTDSSLYPPTHTHTHAHTHTHTHTLDSMSLSPLSELSTESSLCSLSTLSPTQTHRHKRRRAGDTHTEHKTHTETETETETETDRDTIGRYPLRDNNSTLVSVLSPSSPLSSAASSEDTTANILIPLTSNVQTSHNGLGLNQQQHEQQQKHSPVKRELVLSNPVPVFPADSHSLSFSMQCSPVNVAPSSAVFAAIDTSTNGVVSATAAPLLLINDSPSHRCLLPMAVCGMDGAILECNSNFLCLFNIPSFSYLPRLSLFALCDVCDVIGVLEWMERIMSGKEIHMEGARWCKKLNADVILKPVSFTLSHQQQQQEQQHSKTHKHNKPKGTAFSFNVAITPVAGAGSSSSLSLPVNDSNEQEPPLVLSVAAKCAALSIHSAFVSSRQQSRLTDTCIRDDQHHEGIAELLSRSSLSSLFPVCSLSFLSHLTMSPIIDESGSIHRFILICLDKGKTGKQRLTTKTRDTDTDEDLSTPVNGNTTEEQNNELKAAKDNRIRYAYCVSAVASYLTEMINGGNNRKKRGRKDRWNGTDTGTSNHATGPGKAKSARTARH